MSLRSLYVLFFLAIFCSPAWGEIILSVDAEGSSIRQRPDGKDNYLPNTIDGDLLDNQLLLEGQVQGYSRPPSISTTEYRQGSHSLMFQVLPNRQGKERTEYWFEGSRTHPKPHDPAFTSGTKTSRIPWGEERYTGFSFKVPTDYQVGASNFITQFWQRSPQGPPVSLRIFRKNGALRGSIVVINDQGRRVVDRFLITPGVWHDVIFHYTFSRNPKVGFFATWVRPITKGQYRRLKTYRGAIGFKPRKGRGAKKERRGIYHKFGIYRPAKDNRLQTVYIDEVRNAKPSANVFYEIDPSFINPRQAYVLKNVGANAFLSEDNSSPLLATTEQQPQGWQFRYVGEGYYQLVNGNGQVLEARPGDNQAWDRGDKVQLTNPTTQESQQWYLADRGGGNYHIVNRASRFILAGDWGNNQAWESGDAVQLEPMGASAVQLWRFN